MLNKSVKIAIAIVVGILVFILLINVIQKLSPQFSGLKSQITAVLPKTSDFTDFSIYIPSGWKEAKTIPGLSLMVVDEKGISSDAGVNRINFKTYFAVRYDKLNGKTLRDGAVYIKDLIKQTAINVNYTKESEAIINGNEAYKMEADISQQGVDFKVLIVLVKGYDDGVWTVTFNAAKSDWDKYKLEFEKVVNSFKLN